MASIAAITAQQMPRSPNCASGLTSARAPSKRTHADRKFPGRPPRRSSVASSRPTSSGRPSFPDGGPAIGTSGSLSLVPSCPSFWACRSTTSAPTSARRPAPLRLGDRQSKTVAAGIPGDFAEKVDQGVDLTFAQQVEGVTVDGSQQRIEVPGATELVDRLGEAAVLQQPVRRLTMQLAQALRIALLQALVEGVAQGRVIAVLAALARTLLDEQVQPAQLADRLAGIRVPTEFAGQGGVEDLDHRRAFEEGQQLGLQAAQAFFLEELPGMGGGLHGDRPQR